MLKDFKAFAMKGNVIDLAVGIIIGGAFGKIVTSLVNDVIMPVIGLLMGRINFSSLSLHVGDATVKYGQFVQSVIDFLIVAFCIFIMVRQINKLKSKPQPPTETSRSCPFCISSIPLEATRCPFCTSEVKTA